jgi:hypothetical protein
MAHHFQTLLSIPACAATTGCKSECALDIGPWEYRTDRPADFVACSSPTLYSDLPEGEHKFRVRSGLPDVAHHVSQRVLNPRCLI